MLVNSLQLVGQEPGDEREKRMRERLRMREKVGREEERKREEVTRERERGNWKREGRV